MQERTQYEPSPIATDPHTGKQYNFQPLFDYTQEWGNDIGLVEENIQQALDVIPYAFLRLAKEMDELTLLTAWENMKMLRDVFKSINKL